MHEGSHLSRLHHDLAYGKVLFNVIKSAYSEIEGPSHCWLNKICNDDKFLDHDGIFLILVNAYIQDNHLSDHQDRILLIEGVKILQKRYPNLNVIGLQCATSAKSAATHSKALRTILEEYITFPILILDKNLFTVTDSAVYFYESSTGHSFYIKCGTELAYIHKAIEELSTFPKEDMSEELNRYKPNQNATIEEPDAAAYFRDLLLSYAGSLSVDEDGGRIFLSDSNHHRIIITNGDGKILDLIGSSPGFVDSDFEEAKLYRPAASFYNVSDGCLYFVDSENNAIRRADIRRRLVETMYPVPRSSDRWSNILGVWSSILKYFGLAKKNEKTRELFLDTIASPWHLLSLEDNELIIIGRSFAVAWSMNMATWKIKEVIRGFENIFEIYGNLIVDKLSLLKDAYDALPLQKFSTPVSLENFLYAGLMSSIGNFGDDIIIYDSVGQDLLKYNRKSRCISHIHFSNVGLLGVPYWLNFPVESVFNSNRYIRQPIDHVQNFSVLPGRCEVTVNVKIPEKTILAAPLDENCIWRQARGSACEVSGLMKEEASREKVGVAQQWFDELDNLAFTNPEFENLESDREIDGKTTDRSFQDTDKVQFNCAVNISPGTGEVIVSAALYLKPKPALNIEEVASLLNLQNHERGVMESECISLFLEKHEKVSEIIFTKPLHLRIKLDCGDHPAAPTTKETILTDTRLEVNVTVE